MANQQKRQQDLRKRREVNRIIPLIINNDWEDAERGGELSPQDFFQQNHIRSSTTFEYKIAVMFTMLRENLKFPQLENVTDDNPQELHHLLMNLFGTTEDNTLSMIHIFACILSNKSNNLIKNLINNSAQGQSIFMERWGRAGMTLLHWVCHNNASDDVIDKLIDVGGRNLVMATDKFERSALQLAFHTNASDNIINKLIDVGGKEYVVATESNGRTVLHEACHKNASYNVINKLIGVGGNELVVATDKYGYTALHFACRFNASLKSINRLIDVGDKNLVMSTDKYGCTALHFACRFNASLNSINRLIDIGGEDLVMATDKYGCTALHFACRFNGPDDVSNRLIDAGGKNLVMATNNDGRTALHFACRFNGTDDVTNKLVDVGGKELVMKTDKYGCTALHFTCCFNSSVDVINKLVDVGGTKLLSGKHNEGKYALIFLLCTRDQTENKNGKVSSLISKGIQLEVGGEFGIGGLFNFASEEEQSKIYQNWNDTIIPALEMNMTVISGQPILQAAIIAKAPCHIIRDIISRFDCITSQDSMGRYPIDLAITEGLKWDDGMEDIVRRFTALTAAQQGQARLMINVAALYGLKWENGMDKVAEESMNEVGNNNVDVLTGLLPFMLAAVGGSTDLSSIYELMQKSPYNVISFNRSCKRQGNQDIHQTLCKKRRKNECSK